MTPLEVFQAHRSLLMGGAWARILLLFPMVVLGIALPRLLDADLLQTRIATALALLGGALSAVSGVVAVAVGVTAEELLPLDGSSRSVAVLADSLDWVQDNLLTLSLITFSAALAALSSPLRKAGALPSWGRRAGQVSVVLAGAIPMSFYVGGADHGSPLYALPAFGAEAAILLWFVALTSSGPVDRERLLVSLSTPSGSARSTCDDLSGAGVACAVSETALVGHHGDGDRRRGPSRRRSSPPDRLDPMSGRVDVLAATGPGRRRARLPTTQGRSRRAGWT